MRLYIYKLDRVVAVVTLDEANGRLDVQVFDEAERRAIEDLVLSPIEHEWGGVAEVDGAKVLATGTKVSQPGTEEHFLALRLELTFQDYEVGFEEVIQEQAATA